MWKGTAHLRLEGSEGMMKKPSGAGDEGQSFLYEGVAILQRTDQVTNKMNHGNSR